MSIVADSARGGLDRASMAKALSKCLQTASLYGKAADTDVLMTDAVSLQNAMPEFARSQRLSFVWNSVDGAPNTTPTPEHQGCVHGAHERPEQQVLQCSRLAIIVRLCVAAQNSCW